MPNALSYIMDHGVHLEKSYPYTGIIEECENDFAPGPKYRVSGCSLVDPTTDGLTQALRSQPVAVAFCVAFDFQHYKEGVYQSEYCDSTPNHAVLAVGFDLSADVPFYRVKNSWGETWGESGYFRIAIGAGSGTCRIAGSGSNVVPII